ncbi:MAG: hypothetical protein R3B06_02600 [Kofleriaceae bacterium]
MLARWSARLGAPLLAALAAAACKSKPPPPPPVAPADAAGLDGTGAAIVEPADPPGPAAGDVPDEATLRAGKRTGLAAADERPEVATEALAEALLAGQVPWTRLVDPARGVVELRTVDTAGHARAPALERRCGTDADAALAAWTAGVTQALATPALGYRLTCDNSGLAEGAALCSVDADAEGAFAFDLVLVPDAERGLRVAGLTALDPIPPPVDVADAFDLALGQADARCR